MIQVEATQKLRAAMEKAFGQAILVNFMKRLDVDLDPQMKFQEEVKEPYGDMTDRSALKKTPRDQAQNNTVNESIDLSPRDPKKTPPQLFTQPTLALTLQKSSLTQPKRKKRSPNAQIDEEKEDTSTEFLTIGDIIILQYTQRVYMADIVQQREIHNEDFVDEIQNEKWEKEQRKKNRNRDMGSSKFKALPEYTYKGMVYADGIKDNQLTILPKDTAEGTKNGKCQFKKCLFRVEMKGECKYAQLEQEMVIKIKTLVEDKEEARKIGNSKLAASLQNEIKKTEEKHMQIKRHLQREISNNEYQQRINIGKKVQFGEAVQLRHVFTNQFLSVDPLHLSEDHGKIEVQLTEVNSSFAWLKFIPAQDSRQFASEMLINSNQMNNFNLQVGGQINLKEAFYILNSETSQMFYLFISTDTACGEDRTESVLDMNAGLEPTRLTAKLFLPSGAENITGKQDGLEKKASQVVFSGDTVRLLQREAGSYLQSSSKYSGSRSMFDQYPDFLVRQITRVTGNKELLRKLNKDPDISDKDSELEEYEREREKRIKKGDISLESEEELNNDQNIYVEQDPRQQSFTDSCWELQDARNPLRGSVITLNGLYRLKHATTQKFLAVDSEGVSLYLHDGFAENAAFYNTIFTFRSPNQDQRDSEELPLKDHTTVYIETYQQKFLQIFFDMDDEITNLFTYVDRNLHSYYNRRDTAISDTRVGIVAGQRQLKCEDSEPKMVFSVRKVPKSQAFIAFQCYSFMEAISIYFAFLNMWGVIDTDRRFNPRNKRCYDADECHKTRDTLGEQTDIIYAVLKSAYGMLTKARDTSAADLEKMQNHFKEQRILEALCYLLELIYYKTTPEKQMEKPFTQDRFATKMQSQELDREEDMAFIIARQFLDEIADLVLKLIQVLTFRNAENCERLTYFIDTMFDMYGRYDPKMVVKILRHAVKHARYIFKDRASVIQSEQGICNDLPENFTNTHQIVRWLDMLDSVQVTRVMGSRNQEYDKSFIRKQIDYLNLITSFCKHPEDGKAKLHYQMIVINKILSVERRIPMWFGAQRQYQGQKLPFVYFERLNNEPHEEFIEKNPMLKSCCCPSMDQDHRKFDKVYDLNDMTKNITKFPDLHVYYEYIAAVVNLYAILCADRNIDAVRIMRERIGISNHFLLAVTGLGDEFKIDQRVKTAFMNLARNMLLNYEPFNEWSDDSKVRVYFWDKLQKHDPYQTIYRWEKAKYAHVEQYNNRGFSKQEVEETASTLRKVVKKYFELGPVEIQQFFQNYRAKHYTGDMVDPKLMEMGVYFDAAISLIKSDNIDSVFIQFFSSEIVSVILIGYADEKFHHIFANSWVYKMCRVARSIPESKVKFNKIVYKSLQIINLFCKHRLGQQTLLFLKMFKAFEEENEVSHVNFDPRAMEIGFKNIFSIHQFNLDATALQRFLLMLNTQLVAGRDIEIEQNDIMNRREQMKEFAKEKVPVIKSQNFQFTNAAPMAMAKKHQNDDDMMDSEESDGGTTEKKDDESLKSIKLKDSLTEIEEPKKDNSLLKKTNLINKSNPLDEYLLYFAFYRTADPRIPSLALTILNQNTEQRALLLSAVLKTEILVSTEDKAMFREVRNLRDQVAAVAETLALQELRFLIFRVATSDHLTSKLSEAIKLFQKLVKMLQTAEDDGLKLKLQNMMKQVDIVDIIVNRLMKRLYYDKQHYKKLFSTMLEVLYEYSYKNPNTQLSLKQHLVYITAMMGFDLPVCKIAAQIISQDRHKGFGQKYMLFMMRKMTNEKCYKSQVFRLLSVAVRNSHRLQTFALAQLVQDPSFRHRIYLQPHTEKIKIDHIKELLRTKLQASQHNQNDFDLSNMEEQAEKVNVHLALIDFIAVAAAKNAVGVQQLIRIVDQDCILNALLAQSVPYIMKRSYFRLLLQGFLTPMKGHKTTMDINQERFIKVMNFVVLYDFEYGYNFYAGLVINESATGKVVVGTEELHIGRVKEDLEKQTQEQYNKLNQKKNKKTKMNKNKIMSELSTLNEARPFPFIEHAKNFREYWDYLYFFDVELDHADGLLCFVRDFYEIAAKMRSEWSEDLSQVTVLLKKTLMRVLDKLFNIKDMYTDSLIEMQDMLYAFDQAIGAIPDMRKTEEDEEEEEKKKLGNLAEEDYEEYDPEATKENIIKVVENRIIVQKLTIRQCFGIQGTRHDTLIHPFYLKFKLKQICGTEVPFAEIDWLVRHLMITKAKAQMHKNVTDIELGQEGHVRTRFSFQQMKLEMQKRENKAIYQKENQGVSDQDDQVNYKETVKWFNFSEIEKIVKIHLIRSGFKPPVIKRNKANQEIDFMMEMSESELSTGCSEDFQQFVKCYMEWSIKFRDTLEINDLSQKVLIKFNYAFIRGGAANSEGTDLKDYQAIKLFLRNMVQSVDQQRKKDKKKMQSAQTAEAERQNLSSKLDNKLFVLKLMNTMLRSVIPSKLEPKLRPAATLRLRILQNLMIESGCTKLAIQMISSDEKMIVVDEAISLIQNLVMEGNQKAAKALVNLLKQQSNLFIFFGIIKYKIRDAVTQIIQLQNRNSNQETNAYFETLRQGAPGPSDEYLILHNRTVVHDRCANLLETKFQADRTVRGLMDQPSYLPENYNLEINFIQSVKSRAEELLFLLQFIRTLCDVGQDDETTMEWDGELSTKNQRSSYSSEIINLLRTQTKDQIKDINLIDAIADCLIRMTTSLQGKIYKSTTCLRVLRTAFQTLQCISDGKSTAVQLFFAQHRQLQNTLNFYLEQDMGQYLVDSAENRAKLEMMSRTLRLIRAILDLPCNDESLRVQVMKDVAEQIKFQNLKSKLIDIFKFKIGGTPHRDYVYRTSKMCLHTDTIMNDVGGDDWRARNVKFCEKGEYCFFDHLLPLDHLTIKCAFNIFFFIQKAIEVLPPAETAVIKFSVESNVESFERNMKAFRAQLYQESVHGKKETIIATRQRQTGVSYSTEEEAKDVNRMLMGLYVKSGMKKHRSEQDEEATKKGMVGDGIGLPTDTIYEKELAYDLFKAEQDLQLIGGIDKQDRMIPAGNEEVDENKQNKQEIQLMEDEMDQEPEWEEHFIEQVFGKRQLPWYKRFCCTKPVADASWGERTVRVVFCCSCCSKQEKVKAKTALELAQQRIYRYTHTTDKVEKTKIMKNFKKRELQIQQKRKHLGQFFGSLTKQLLQQSSYTFEQFKYDYIFRFFLSEVGTVEVVLNDGTIRKEVFIIPAYCSFLTKQTRDQIETNAVESEMGNHRAKLRYFIKTTLSNYREEMLSQQSLARTSILLKILAKIWHILQKISLALTITVNLIFVAFFTKIIEQVPDDCFYEPKTIVSLNQPALTPLVDFITVVNASLAILIVISYYTEFRGVLRSTLKRKISSGVQVKTASAGMKAQRGSTGWAEQEDLLAILIAKSMKKEKEAEGKGGATSRLFREICFSVNTFLLSPFIDESQAKNTFNLALAIIGITYQQVYTLLLLVQIIDHISFLRSLVSVLYRNRQKLLWTFLLLALLIYMFAFIAFYAYPQFDQECMTLYHCYFLLINQAVQEQSVRETLLTFMGARPDDDITMQLDMYPESAGSVNLSWEEYLMDMAFFLLIVIITLNLVLGLLIDAMAEMRAKNTLKDEELANKCFICDISKADLLSQKMSFDGHTSRDHNVHSYLYYILALLDKDYEECSFVERYVRSKVERQDVSFFPVKTCRELQEKRKQEQKAQ